MELTIEDLKQRCEKFGNKFISVDDKKATLECPKHGLFEKSIYTIGRHGCSKCGIDVRTSKLKKHESCNTRLYNIWHHIKERCSKEYCKEYKYYGARGISYYEEWDKFIPFQQWALSNGYEDNLELDREDNNGNYEPSNCRWVTKTVNANNKRNNVFVLYLGKNQTIAEWAKELEIPYKSLWMRYKRGNRGEYLFRPIKIAS